MVLRTGNIVASQAMNTQSDDTKANWTSVRVAGMLKALRIDFDEVLVKAEEKYHVMQRIWMRISIYVKIVCEPPARGSDVQLAWEIRAP